MSSELDRLAIDIGVLLRKHDNLNLISWEELISWAYDMYECGLLSIDTFEELESIGQGIRQEMRVRNG